MVNTLHMGLTLNSILIDNKQTGKTIPESEISPFKTKFSIKHIFYLNKKIRLRLNCSKFNILARM